MLRCGYLRYKSSYRLMSFFIHRSKTPFLIYPFFFTQDKEFENFSEPKKKNYRKIISKWSDNFTRFVNNATSLSKCKKHVQSEQGDNLFFGSNFLCSYQRYCFQFLLIKLKPFVLSPRCGRFFTMFYCQTYFSWLHTSKLDKQ